MLTRGGLRSSALARAQAQLSGKRVPLQPKDSNDELKEYMNALNKKASALKLSQQSVADLSDFSAEEQETERYKGSDSPLQAPHTHSRFLKKKQVHEEKTWEAKNSGTTDKKIASVPSLVPVQSKMPTSAALKKLAEIENRHRLRRLEVDASENDSDLRISDERPFSAKSSSDLSARGTIFLKKNSNIKGPEYEMPKGGLVGWGKPAESKRVTMESEDEEIRHLFGSSVEMSEDSDRWWKLPKPPRTPSPPSKGSPCRNLHRSPSALGFSSPRRPSSRFFSRTPSPPSHRASRVAHRTRSLSRMGSRSPSPSIRSSLTNPSSPRARLGRQSRTPLSQRSDLKSLDELFSRTEDVSSASSNDFKINILSLDDLAPVADTEEAKKVSDGLLKMGDRKLLFATQDEEPSHHKRAELLIQQASISEEESAAEVQTEKHEASEISEDLHHDSPSSHEDHSLGTLQENSVNSAYSEDFDSVHSVASETGQESDSSSSLKSTSSTERQRSTNRSFSHTSKPRRTKRWGENVQRVIMREMAVQTSEPGFTYYWPQANCGLGHPPPFVEPVQIASHVVTPEQIEALTTYSPMALVLNDMLKQQLFLTQTFVDMARQHHLSTVKSLEAEMYQYTTLEDTKEYLRHQRSLRTKLRGGTNGQHPLTVQSSNSALLKASHQEKTYSEPHAS
ncbi:uncharacterized protein C19orf44 homolog [Rhinophrynus dorsalis]